MNIIVILLIPFKKIYYEYYCIFSKFVKNKWQIDNNSSYIGDMICAFVLNYYFDHFSTVIFEANR